jgi:PTS system nitrogen regulatory IIA component
MQPGAHTSSSCSIALPLMGFALRHSVTKRPTKRAAAIRPGYDRCVRLTCSPSLRPGSFARPGSVMEPVEVNALAKYMPPQNVLLDLDVADKADLFDVIGRQVEGAHRVQHKLVVHGLSRREQAGSTGLGEGLALPHARIEGLDRIQVLYARLKSPIPFGAPDRKPVSDVLVLLVPYPASEEHLQLLSAFSPPGRMARRRSGPDTFCDGRRKRLRAR